MKRKQSDYEIKHGEEKTFMGNLNKKLYEAIKSNCKDWIHPVDIEKMSISCEKIVLQEQIDLLKEVRYGLIQRGVIDLFINDIQKQLNNLP